MKPRMAFPRNDSNRETVGQIRELLPTEERSKRYNANQTPPPPSRKKRIKRTSHHWMQPHTVSLYTMPMGRQHIKWWLVSLIYESLQSRCLSSTQNFHVSFGMHSSILPTKRSRAPVLRWRCTNVRSWQEAQVLAI